MNRRKFLHRTVAGSAALAAASSTAFARSAEKPNVLLVITDQMRQPRWFPEGSKLPNLERLKERGIEFTRHFVSAVPCSPSRACLMTGLHMDQNNVRKNVRENYGAPLNPRIPTLGLLFRQAGYKTPYFGKWHLSLKENKKNGLDPYGFTNLTPKGKRSEYLTPGLAQDPGVTSAACKWLEERPEKGKPFFLTVSLINPHDICTYPRIGLPPILIPNVIHDLPGNWDDDLEGKPHCQIEYQKAFQKIAGRIKDNDQKAWRELLDFYYFLNRRADAQLGRVLQALDQSGEAKNTIVIFTSDHGEMGGSHRLRSKGPFVYEENTNTPLVVAWPGVTEKGAQTKSLVQNVDLFPTLADLLGFRGAYSYLPGHSLMAVLDNPAKEVNNHVLFSYEGSRSMEPGGDDDGKGKGKGSLKSPHFIRALRTHDAVYARYFQPDFPNEEYELYDLRKDPREMKNVAEAPAYAGLRAELAARLREAQQREMTPIQS
jgi:arylsulfatase